MTLLRTSGSFQNWDEIISSEVIASQKVSILSNLIASHCIYKLANLQKVHIHASHSCWRFIENVSIRRRIYDNFLYIRVFKNIQLVGIIRKVIFYPQLFPSLSFRFIINIINTYSKIHLIHLLTGAEDREWANSYFFRNRYDKCPTIR